MTTKQEKIKRIVKNKAKTLAIAATLIAGSPAVGSGSQAEAKTPETGFKLEMVENSWNPARYAADHNLRYDARLSRGINVTGNRNGSHYGYYGAYVSRDNGKVFFLPNDRNDGITTYTNYKSALEAQRCHTGPYDCSNQPGYGRYHGSPGASRVQNTIEGVFEIIDGISRISR